MVSEFLKFQLQLYSPLPLPSDRLGDYLALLDRPVPQHSNPSDHAISIVNTEFFDTNSSTLTAAEHIVEMTSIWRKHGADFVVHSTTRTDGELIPRRVTSPFLDAMFATKVLMKRNITNYSRNLLAFGIRFGMCELVLFPRVEDPLTRFAHFQDCAMGFLLATVWINLGTASAKIQDRLSVFFFSVAFLGFSTSTDPPPSPSSRLTRPRHSVRLWNSRLPRGRLTFTLSNLTFRN